MREDAPMTLASMKPSCDSAKGCFERMTTMGRGAPEKTSSLKRCERQNTAGCLTATYHIEGPSEPRPASATDWFCMRNMCKVWFQQSKKKGSRKKELPPKQIWLQVSSTVRIVWLLQIKHMKTKHWSHLRKPSSGLSLWTPRLEAGGHSWLDVTSW